MHNGVDSIQRSFQFEIVRVRGIADPPNGMQCKNYNHFKELSNDFFIPSRAGKGKGHRGRCIVFHSKNRFPIEISHQRANSEDPQYKTKEISHSQPENEPMQDRLTDASEALVRHIPIFDMNVPLKQVIYPSPTLDSVAHTRMTEKYNKVSTEGMTLL